MKVVHLTSVHEWNDTRIFIKMCRSLASIGHDVHFVVPRAEGAGLKIVDGVNIHFVPMASGRISRMFQTVRAVLRVAESLKADIYHFHDPEFLLWAPYWQKRLGKPFIYDAHEDYRGRVQVKEWVPVILRKPLARLVAGIETWATKRLAGVVAVTPGICRYFENSCRTVLVRNFPRMEEFPFGIEAVWPIDPHFAYVSGVLTAERGIDKAIEAISMLGGEVKLSIAGVWMDETFRKSCEALHGWRQVEYLGYIDRPALAGLMKRSIAGLEIAQATAGYEETYPTKLFECMAAARPIIIADFPVYRPFVDQFKCGLMVDHKDPTRIAEAMHWILEHPEESMAMGMRGRDAVLSCFNWDLEIPVLLNLYKEILGIRE